MNRLAARALPLVLAAALAALALRPRRVAVRGGSMLPTLRPGDHLLVLRLPVRVGDLVVVRVPQPDGEPAGEPLEVVKRLVEVRQEGLVVVGDNPAASTDSRSWGPLPRRALRGRVVYRYAPGERAGRISGGRRA